MTPIARNSHPIVFSERRRVTSTPIVVNDAPIRRSVA